MIGKTLLFELRYQLRRPAFYLSLLGATGLVFLFVSAFAQRAGDAQALIHLNAPLAVARSLALFALFSLIIPLILFANAALRDVASGMDELVKATPVRMGGLLLSRFIAAFLAATLIYLWAAPATELALHMWWIDPRAVGPVNPLAYVQIYALLLLPNLFVFGAVVFCASVWTRSATVGYGILLLFMVLVIVGTRTGLGKAMPEVGALGDPFGLGAINQLTRYWTPSDQAQNFLPFEGILVWNRALWVGGAFVLLALTMAFLPRTVRGSRAKITDRPSLAAVAIHAPTVRPGQVSVLGQLLMRTRYEAAVAVRSWTFLFILLLLGGGCFIFLAYPDLATTLPLFPVTEIVAPRISGAAAIGGLLLVILLTGEFVWRERSSRVAEILDVTPAPSIVFLGGKLGALMVLIAIYLLLAIVIGIGFQLWRGSYDIALDVYVVFMLFDIGLPLAMYAVLTLFLHMLAPNKYLGHLISVGVVAGWLTASYFGFEDGLVQFGNIPTMPLSVMNGFGHYLTSAIWFSIYWGSITLLLVIAAQLLWVRGTRAPLRARIGAARAALTPAMTGASLAMLAIAIASGGVIYWNTHIRNQYFTTSDAERFQADYERAFAADLRTPQPRITEIDMAVDIDPARRIIASRGTYRLVNHTDAPIETVRVQFNDEYAIETIALDQSRLVAQQRRFNDYVFRPETPLAPGGALTLSFAGQLSSAGFQHGNQATQINGNGTFAHNILFAPWIGVNHALFITDELRRGKQDLPTLVSVDNKGLTDQNRSFLSADADFIRFGVTLSTASDQIALAPGALTRDWQEGGRHFFRYEADRPMPNFWSVLSARYRKAEAKWHDVPLAVYYHPTQGQNVPHMLATMRQALDIYTEAFGPFPHRQLRIAEFPYGQIAQSFPATIAYAEALGFIAADSAYKTLDYVGYITAHEVAHQWWGHQAVPADMPGAQLLSETLAEYSSLLVMEKLYGRDGVRDYLRNDLNQYLAQRGLADRERPLALVRMHQAHIAYKKGALAMFALKDAIGADAVNRALRRYLDRYREQAAPYPTAADLIQILRDEAGPDYDGLITDLFEKITFWDLQVMSANAAPRPDGKWRVRVVIGAGKIAADETGAEQRVGMRDLVSIGLFSTDPFADGAQTPIALEKRLVTGAFFTADLVTDRRPAFAAVNPDLALIEKNLDNNVVALPVPQSPPSKKPSADNATQ